MGAAVLCLALPWATSGFAVAAETVEIVVDQMKFLPPQLKIKAGTTVRWVNKERRTNHSVWFQKEGLPESERFFPGESWSRTFARPGVYPYICGPHPEMTGVIEVLP
jgi:plastocyanin